MIIKNHVVKKVLKELKFDVDVPRGQRNQLKELQEDLLE